MSPAVSDHDEYFLDPRSVRRAFDRASARFDAFAGVHSEIRARLLERLDVVKLQPAVVLDVGAGTGHSTRALQDRYRSAQVVALDISTGMLQQARKQQRFLRRFARIATDAQRLAIQSARADLVFSNLMLQWCAEPDQAFTEMARVLKPHGLLTFTALGPDTLRELRASRAGREFVRVHRFIDMHDLGDALVRVGFAEPVMDTERLTITYRDVDSLLRELKGSGSANIAHGRARGLSGPQTFRDLRARYELLRENAVLPVTLEVIYGHAWAGDPAARRRRGAGGVVNVPIGSIGRR